MTLPAQPEMPPGFPDQSLRQGMPTRVFTIGVSLPNKEHADLIFSKRRHDNVIAHCIVNSLSKTGEIIQEGDRVFVEFYRWVQGTLYMDGAWCWIRSGKHPFISLGQKWWEERHVVMDSEWCNCTLQSPHLKGEFRFLNSSLRPSKTTKMTLKPTANLPISTANTASSTAPSSSRRTDLDLSHAIVEVSPPSNLPTWDHALFIKAGLDVISNSVFETDSQFISIHATVDAWDQKLFIESESHQISEDIFNDDYADIFVVAFKRSDHVPIPKMTHFDLIWQDYLDTSVKQHHVLFELSNSHKPSASVRVATAWILQHFKTRGQVFSNRRRIDGNKHRHEIFHQFGGIISEIFSYFKIFLKCKNFKF